MKKPTNIVMEQIILGRSVQTGTIHQMIPNANLCRGYRKQSSEQITINQ